MGRILQGYSFPLTPGRNAHVASCTLLRNPKWVVCDKGSELSIRWPLLGWREVFQRLRNNKEASRNLSAWFPPLGFYNVLYTFCFIFLILRLGSHLWPGLTRLRHCEWLRLERIDQLCERFPLGFQEPPGVHDMDLHLAAPL